METKETLTAGEIAVKVWDMALASASSGEGYYAVRTNTLEWAMDEIKSKEEISFKAGMKQGIWLFAWWKDGVQYVGTSGRTLEQAYKELGINET